MSEYDAHKGLLHAAQYKRKQDVQNAWAARKAKEARINKWCRAGVYVCFAILTGMACAPVVRFAWVVFVG